MDDRDGLRCGHAPGGVAIMWRASLDKHVTPLKLDINWLSGIRIQFENQVYIILSVYMPYECRENVDDYLENLGVIKTIIDELQCTCISVLGDWNSDISDHASIFGRQLMTSCADNNMILSSKSHLSIDTLILILIFMIQAEAYIGITPGCAASDLV